MANHFIRQALISVYNKEGVVELASGLCEMGIRVISTGGTCELLRTHAVETVSVEEVVGIAPMLDGRVKTLHPNIHAAILADRENPVHMKQLEEQDIRPIDLVVVNLYPFTCITSDSNCTEAQAIEMIDIGGICLLRSAAKNHKHVLTLTCPTDYIPFLERLRACRGLQDWSSMLSQFAAPGQLFELASGYDRSIATWFNMHDAENPPHPCAHWSLKLREICRLRYGENPHQSAGMYVLDEGGDVSRHALAVELIASSPEMSFNNHGDADSAFRICADLSSLKSPFSESGCVSPSAGQFVSLNEGRQEEIQGQATDPCVCVVVKHLNPCGVGLSKDPLEAFRRAYLGDVRAVMGGVLAVNFSVQASFAAAVMSAYDVWGKSAGAGGFFLEVWIAPKFDEDAITTIRSSKTWGSRVRLVATGQVSEADLRGLEIKRVFGGYLLQSTDSAVFEEQDCRVVSRRSPTAAEWKDLSMAWLVCKHTRSNAITICKDGMLLGNGAGQTSRVRSCRLATWLASDNGHREKLKGAVAASDAFFPFRDGPDILISAGVRAIIQPGGSKRDDETIIACDDQGVALVHTGKRHFRH